MQQRIISDQSFNDQIRVVEKCTKINTKCNIRKSSKRINKQIYSSVDVGVSMKNVPICRSILVRCTITHNLLEGINRENSVS